jgi:dTDP-4-dehydrorhamnose reductase
MQKVLITGANGFVGYYLVRRLVEKNYQVIATGKGENRLTVRSENFIYETMDFTNQKSVEKVFEKYQPDIVVHCGAISKPDECELNKENAFLTNVTGTIYLLQQAEKLKSFFIFLSTDFIFSGEQGMYKEEDRANPVNYYGQTKLLAEEEVEKYPYHWSIVRTVLVYGKPFLNRQNLLTIVANGLRKGEQLKIFDDQIRTPTYVEDLANGIVSIIEKNAQGTYHLSGADVLTPHQMAVAVAEHLHLDSSLIAKIEEHDLKQHARRPLKTGFDITKAKKDLNYKPTPFNIGLSKTFE